MRGPCQSDWLRTNKGPLDVKFGEILMMYVVKGDYPSPSELDKFHWVGLLLFCLQFLLDK